MQVFLPFRDILEVAKCLDYRRLNKQIIECNQIIDIYNGKTKAWSNHPVVAMYRHILWLLENHFDFMGLIPKGLALEAPKDMYN